MWSLGLHVLALVAMSLSISHKVKLSTPSIQVKLVGVPQPTAQSKKVEPEKIRTQDSAAPKEPPPDAKNIPPSDATSKFAMDKPKEMDPNKKVNHVNAKERPPVLDKSPKEKKVVKNDLDAKVVQKPEDFLESIDDFLSDSKPTTKPTPSAKATEKPSGDGPQLQMNLADNAVTEGIGQAVNKNWFYQGYDVTGLSVTVQVNVSADGQLENVRVIKSSGNAAFDSSLIRAIRKTDPLPIPSDKIGGYREFNMTFNR
jgi:colicin import membrane protein